MRGYCDLHTHSYFSDGTYSPTELIDEAEGIGLGAIALTDHNTVKGLPEFISAARGKQIRAVAGVELSTEYRGCELHILALNIPERAFGEITELTEEMHRLKEISNILLISALNDAGYAISYQKIKENARGKVNRSHIASALLEKGYISSVQEGFDTLLSPKNEFYTPPKRLGALDTVGFIRSIGAIPVLAHPFLSVDEEMLRTFLTDVSPLGLAAMETMYSKYDENTTALAKRIAAEFSIKESGGSDFHGTRKPDIALGKGMGDLFIPIKMLDELLDS